MAATGSRAREAPATTPNPTSPTAKIPPPMSATVVTSMLGKTVVAIRISDSSTSTATITRRERVQPRRVAPRAEHLAVVAQQQQEHGRARQQDAGERLHGERDHAQRRAGDQHDRRGAGDQRREDPVERLRVAEAAVQRALGAEHVAERVAGRERQRAGADQRRVQQHEREERTRRPTRARWSSALAVAPGVGEVAEVRGALERERRHADQRRGADHDHERADPRVEPLVVDPPRA